MQRPRTPSKLSESLHQRLNSYALAASATGVSLLALAQPSEARIVYTRAHHVIDRNHWTYQLDLNHDGVRDFVLRSVTGIAVDSLNIYPNFNNQIWGYRTQSQIRFASALRAGVEVRSSAKLGSGKNVMLRCFSGTGTTSTCRGAWNNVKNRYLGLKFYINGKAHYGWARLSTVHGYLLTGYAYETIPNKPIIAGKTHGKAVVTVEPASLGALATLANGLHTWRRK